METAKIKQNVAYATCDGSYVEPVEPVHQYYAWVRTDDGERVIKDVSNAVQRGEVPKQGTDPWAACHRSGGARVRHEPIVGRRGILMTQYDVDRDGVRIDETAEKVIIEPKDVKGTWVQYLSLYAHVIQKRVDEETARADRKQRRDDALERLRTAFPGYVVDISQSTYRDYVTISLTRENGSSLDDVESFVDELTQR